MKVKSKMCFAFITYGLCNLPITVEAFFKYAVFFFFFFDIALTLSIIQCYCSGPVPCRRFPLLSARQTHLGHLRRLRHCSQCISHRYLSSYNLSNTHLHITAVVNNNTPKTQCKINLTFQSKKPPNFKVVLEW